MTKTSTPKLAPVVAKTAKAAATLAQQDGRKRPIVAINEDGKLVVCCRRTAKKNGWQVQDVLYERPKAASKVEAAPAPEPVKARRATDSTEAKAKVKKAKAVVDAALDDILGK
jgi:hypothetical protein